MGEDPTSQQDFHGIVISDILSFFQLFMLRIILMKIFGNHLLCNMKYSFLVSGQSLGNLF